MSDRLAATVGLLMILLVLASIAFAVWLRFFAPCGAVGWLPVHEIPSRCLTVVRP